MLEILGEPTAAVEPCEGPLDHPAARQQDEAFALSERLAISSVNFPTFVSASSSFGPP